MTTERTKLGQRTVIIAVAVLSLFGSVSAVQANESQPNILFIFADDWGWGDLSCHGHPYVKTLNIDRLAEEGTDFHRFTVANGVCSPSRTAVMTGHFPARYNINGHFAWAHRNASRNMPDWLDPKAPLLSRFLQEAGYATGHFGKWHLSNNMIPDSPVPTAYGYDAYGAFNCSGEQMPFYKDADLTIEFIEKAKADGKPYFVNLWVHEPHTPFHTVPKYRWGAGLGGRFGEGPVWGQLTRWGAGLGTTDQVWFWGRPSMGRLTRVRRGDDGHA